jgi:protein-disulfide isomerase
MATLKTSINKSDHVRGPMKAAVTLVEYGDYQCPHCGMAHPIVNQVQDYFRNSLRFVFRHFPLTEAHPLAEVAAESAEFAGTAGLFWEMHDALFENQSILSLPTIFMIADRLRLPEAPLRNALETGQCTDKVRGDFMSGVRSGVNGTPAFFINGERHDGSYEFDSLASAIQLRLRANSHA